MSYHYTDIMYLIHQRLEQLREYQGYKHTRAKQPLKCQECGKFSRGHMYTKKLKALCPSCKEYTDYAHQELMRLENKLKEDIQAQ
jgi:phage FluMu protein Com